MAHARHSWELEDTIPYAMRWQERWDQDSVLAGEIDGSAKRNFVTGRV